MAKNGQITAKLAIKLPELVKNIFSRHSTIVYKAFCLWGENAYYMGGKIIISLQKLKKAQSEGKGLYRCAEYFLKKA